MNKKKVALVGFHLHIGGGARVMSIISNYLHEQNFEVHNIILQDDLGFHYSGELLNLGKFKSKRMTIFNKFKRFMIFRRYLKQQNVNFIIDFRFRKGILKEFLISRFVYNRKNTIYTIHSSKLDVYMPKSTFWTNVIYGGSFRLLTLTKEMEKATKLKYPKLKNVSTMANPININEIVDKAKENIDLGFEYIIGAGSYDVNIKQFDKLILAYSKSVLPKQHIHLVILGQGKLLEYLKTVAIKNKVDKLVHFLGYKSNPYKYFSKSKYFVLSSEFEGLPMVVLEALACSVPVVAFNCPTGPKDAVTHKENGLLIEHQNVEALTSGMNTFIEDNNLYKHCKNNALKSAHKYSIDVIGKKWLNLINIVSQK
tara:strand:+ start:6053 stop:7156 length:1104 start_codon:yes stop_codon:yes gene_type:complete